MIQKPLPPTLMQLVRKARSHYPHSRDMQRQWIKKTTHLYMTGKHALLTGGWRSL